MQPIEPIILCYSTTKHVGDWTIAIHKPHGNKDHDRKHVHISKKGLSGEYSWNIDGTRHDNHRFPNTEKCIKTAKEHAATALGVSVATLSFMYGFEGGNNITLHSEFSGMPLFNAYVSQRLIFTILASQLGLVVVICENS